MPIYEITDPANKAAPVRMVRAKTHVSARTFASQKLEVRLCSSERAAILGARGVKIEKAYNDPQLDVEDVAPPAKDNTLPGGET